MNEFDLFLRGEGKGWYKDAHVYLYLVKLDKVNGVLYDYYDNYNNLDKLSRHADPEPCGFYIPEINTVVFYDRYRYRDIEQKPENINVLFAGDVISEIKSKIEEQVWTREEVTSLLTPEHVDKIYDEAVKEMDFFSPFIKGQDSLNINITEYSFSDLSNQAVYDYLMNPDEFIKQSVDDFIASEDNRWKFKAVQNSAAYQRYRDTHLKEGAYKRELRLVQILNNELPNAKKIWLHTGSQWKKQVNNSFSIEGKRLRLGRYGEYVYSEDVIAVEYGKKKYVLDEEE